MKHEDLQRMLREDGYLTNGQASKLADKLLSLLSASKPAAQDVPHIASVYEDSDGTKYVQFDVEDAEDIPVGTKLYPVARTLTRLEIEEIAGYVENECKACSGMTTLYIAAEAAVEETLRRIADPAAPAQSGDLKDWRVGLFYSSSNPRKQVRVLADGHARIAEYENHHSFVQWIDAAPPSQHAEGGETQTPFSNCRFKICDLPGQCRGEGKCHHPAVAAASSAVGLDDGQTTQPTAEQIRSMGACASLAESMGHRLIAKHVRDYLGARAASPQPAQTERALTYPAEFTDELEWILGLMCFQCIQYAQTLRKAGRDIPSKAESEQAATLDWMLRHYLADPANWRKTASAEMRAMAAAQPERGATET